MACVLNCLINDICLIAFPLALGTGRGFCPSGIFHGMEHVLCFWDAGISQVRVKIQLFFIFAKSNSNWITDLPPKIAQKCSLCKNIYFSRSFSYIYYSSNILLFFLGIWRSCFSLGGGGPSLHFCPLRLETKAGCEHPTATGDDRGCDVNLVTSHHINVEGWRLGFFLHKKKNASEKENRNMKHVCFFFWFGILGGGFGWMFFGGLNRSSAWRGIAVCNQRSRQTLLVPRTWPWLFSWVPCEALKWRNGALECWKPMNLCILMCQYHQKSSRWMRRSIVFEGYIFNLWKRTQ